LGSDWREKNLRLSRLYFALYAGSGEEGTCNVPSQAINYDWRLYFPTVLDLRKALRHSTFPEIPERNQILIPNAGLNQFIDYMEECINNPQIDKIAIDVETIQPGSPYEELGISHSPSLPCRFSC